MCTNLVTVTALSNHLITMCTNLVTDTVSVPDPEVLGLPDPDPLVRGTVRYGSEIFYPQAKIVRKTLISTVLWLRFDFVSLKNDVNVPSKGNGVLFLLASWRSLTKKGRIRIRLSEVRIPDPDPSKMSRIKCTTWVTVTALTFHLAAQYKLHAVTTLTNYPGSPPRGAVAERLQFFTVQGATTLVDATALTNRACYIHLPEWM